jgi:uncharacterized protein YgiM (DUF1202 family)
MKRLMMAVCALAISVSSFAQDVAAPAVTCNSIHVFSIDNDPAGLNIRNKPTSRGSVVLDVIPHSASYYGDFDELGNTTVALRGSTKDGKWVLVEMTYSDYMNPEAGKIVIGWVYGKLLGVDSRGYPDADRNIYYTPTRNSVKGKIQSGDDGTLMKIQGCNHNRIKTTYKGINGWVDSSATCSALMTTCS